MKHFVQTKQAKRMGSGFLFALTMLSMNLMETNPMMAASWDGFKQSMTEFFKHGLGGSGMEGIGMAIAVIGVVAAAISFLRSSCASLVAACTFPTG